MTSDPPVVVAPPPVPSSPLLPDGLRRPAMLVWTAILPQVILLLLNGFNFWLLWGEMDAARQGAASVVIGLNLLFPLVVFFVYLGMKALRRDKIPLWLNAVFILPPTAYLWYFTVNAPEMMPAVGLGWIVDWQTMVYHQYAFQMPAIFYGLWGISAFPRHGSRLRAVLVAAAVTVLPPGAVYLTAVGGAWFSSQMGQFGMRPPGLLSGLFVITLVTGATLGTLVLLLGLLRLLSLLLDWVFVLPGKWLRGLFVLLIALILPLAGMLVNRTVLPFPADFQNPWAYGLLFVNAFFLIVPAFGNPRLERVRWMGRCLCVGFTLYFFLVFLPFLPLSILAILLAGTGFLMLTPLALLLVHVSLLREDFGRETSRVGSFRCMVVGLLLMTGLPLLAGLQAEADRYGLHAALNYLYAPDYTREPRLRAPPFLVRRALLNLRDFKAGTTLPFLGAYYNWRVFDNLVLPDDRLKEMYRVFFGTVLPETGEGGSPAELWRDVRGGRRLGASPPARLRELPRDVRLADVHMAPLKADAGAGATACRLRLMLENHDANNAEFVTRLRLPPGVWVAGFQLKIGEKWVSSRICERKAADWVYRMIRDVSRRDPGYLAYVNDRNLELRVFPFAAGERREAEIELLLPAGLAASVQIGDRVVALGQGPARKTGALMSGAGIPVLAVNRAFTEDWPRLERRPYLLCLVDRSAAAERFTPEAATAEIRRAAGLFPDIADVELAMVNYEMETLPPPRGGVFSPRADGFIRDALERSDLPVRGSVLAGRMLRTAGRLYRDRLRDGRPENPGLRRYPVIVFSGPSARAALAALSAEDFREYLRDVPDIRVVMALEPGRPPRLKLLTESGDVLETDWDTASAEFQARRPVAAVKVPGEVRLLPLTGDESELVAFTGATPSQKPPVFLLPEIKGSRSMTGLVTPESPRLAAGAAAWARQQELVETPSRATELRPLVLQTSRDSGVLTPAGAEIVVENSAQWKILELKHRRMQRAPPGLELIEAPEPGLWFGLLALAGLAAWDCRRRKKKSNVEHSTLNVQH